MTHTAITIPADPELPVTLTNVEDSLKTFQAAVGGLIEAAPIEREDCSLFVNEEGKIYGLPFNPRGDALWHELLPGAWDRPDWMVGDAVLTGFDPDTGDNADVPADLMVRFGFGSAVKVRVGDDDPTPDECDDGCAEQHRAGYRCTWPAGHLTDHVAGSTSGRVVAVWPVTA